MYAIRSYYELAFENTEDNMTIPSIDLLDEHTSTEEKIDESSLQKNAELLQSTLSYNFV